MTQPTVFHNPNLVTAIVATLDAGHHVALHGPTGTGKTFLARHIARNHPPPPNSDFSYAVFHSSVHHRSFIHGIAHPQQAHGPSSAFLDAVSAANDAPNRRVYLIIDEFNRADPADIFMPYWQDVGEHPPIPANMRIIATMCDTPPLPALDRTPLARMFQFHPIPPAFTETWLNHVAQKLSVDPLTVLPYRQRIENTNDYIAAQPDLGPPYLIGHSWLTPDQRHADPMAWLDHVINTQIPFAYSAAFDHIQPRHCERILTILANTGSDKQEAGP